jgi:hypothetical protein
VAVEPLRHVRRQELLGWDELDGPESPSSQRIACDTQAPLDDIEETVSPGASTLSYDPLTDRYQYVWKTDGAWSGSCRQLVVRTADGGVHRANFKFK